MRLIEKFTNQGVKAIVDFSKGNQLVCIFSKKPQDSLYSMMILQVTERSRLIDDGHQHRYAGVFKFVLAH